MSKYKCNAEAVKAAILPSDFYQSELGIVFEGKSGWQNAGLCAFHADRHPRSFGVDLESGAFNCFSCGASGTDIIAFVMLRYGLSFREALEMLAMDWGLYDE